MAAVPVISEVQWARIIAKAYLDGTTGDLEKDPKKFVDGVRAAGANDPPNINLPPPTDPVRLLSIDYSNGYGGPDSVAKDILAIFLGSAHAELQEIFNFGTLDGQSVEMPPSEWIDPYDLRRLFLHGGSAISLTDWMGIYAYIWDQIRFANNQTIREHFEEDPARTLHDPGNPPPPPPFNDEIIANINASRKNTPKALPPIDYTYQKTSLFTLGAPSPPGNLTDIRANPGAMGYRHRIRLTC